MTKTKIMFLGLLLISLLWLVVVIKSGWDLAIQDMTNVFYQESVPVQIVVPKTSLLPVEAQINRIFGKDARVATAVFKAESGLRCNAINRANSNGSVDYGVAQINSIHMKKGYTEANLLDCETNLRVALAIFNRQGFEPWAAYSSGKFKQYLSN